MNPTTAPGGVHAVPTVLADLAGGLWAMACVVVVLAAHVAVNYVRHGRRAPTALSKALHGAAAAASLGTGIWASMLLGMGTEPVAYAFGFRAIGLLAAWLAAVAAAAAGLGLLLRFRNGWAVAAAGLLIPPGAVGCGMLMARAAGFEPGIVWRFEALLLALLVAAAGCVAGLWLALRFPAARRPAPHRRWWRWAAAATLGFSLVSAQELVLSAVGMLSQTASVYREQIPAAVACIVAATGVPTVLLGLLFELRLRGLPRPGDAAAPRRRRRRARHMREPPRPRPRRCR